jgi:hypothetical protein
MQPKKTLFACALVMLSASACHPGAAKTGRWVLEICESDVESGGMTYYVKFER